MSTDKTPNEGYKLPNPADIYWVHGRSGGRYQIMHHGIIEATMAPAVVYRSMTDQTIWVRPASEFFDGRFRMCVEIHDLRKVKTPRGDVLDFDPLD